MHELSIALSIIEGAQEEMQRQGEVHVLAVHLKLGPLSGVVKDALVFSYGLACEGTPLEHSTLIIEEVPIRLYCAGCQTDVDPISSQHLHCATCGSADCRVVAGADLEIVALELSS